MTFNVFYNWFKHDKIWISVTKKDIGDSPKVGLSNTRNGKGDGYCHFSLMAC